MKSPLRWIGAGLILLVLAASSIAWRFQSDMQTARARVAQGAKLIDTPCGPIEYQEAGAGVPLLAVHGSGGGHDHGMAFAGSLAQRGMRVIAMSRFGYLRPPMPARRAGHFTRCCRGLLGRRPVGLSDGHSTSRSGDRVPESAPPSPPWFEALATPLELVTKASAQEQARVAAMLNNILPVSARVHGLKNDTAVGKHLGPSPLASVHAPTVTFSARDDRYGTYASAQYTASQITGARFIGYDEGGHALVGHYDEVMAEVARLLVPQPNP